MLYIQYKNTSLFGLH